MDNSSDQKTSLDLYLTKIAHGDAGYEEKLCRHLAERPLYVPVRDSARKRGRVFAQSDFFLVADAGKNLLPVFTARSLLRRWGQGRGCAGEPAVLLGRDLAAKLESDTWLWLNVGDQGSVSIEPQLVALIARGGSSRPGRRERRPTGTIPRIIDEPSGEEPQESGLIEPSLVVSELIPISLLRGPAQRSSKAGR